MNQDSKSGRLAAILDDVSCSKIKIKSGEASRSLSTMLWQGGLVLSNKEKVIAVQSFQGPN
jgi:hypothetical protein